MIQTVINPTAGSWVEQWQRIISQISVNAQGWWQLDDALEPVAWFADLSAVQKLSLNQRRLEDWLYQQLISGVSYEAEPEQCDRRFNGLNLEFATALHSHNQGTGYWDRDWQIAAAGGDGYWAVTKQDLTIEVLPEEHLPPGIEMQIGHRVEVKMPKNLVEAERYMAVANVGKPLGQSIQIYFHCDRTNVLPLMQSVTGGLNQRSIPFTLAVPYDPFEYPRWDAGVLVLTEADWQKIQRLAQDWGQYLLPGEPWLAKRITAGMAIVELAAATEKFGWARCKLIAEGILTAAASDHGLAENCTDNLIEHATAYVQRCFAEKELDFIQPYHRAGRVDSV